MAVRVGPYELRSRLGAEGDDELWDALQVDDLPKPAFVRDAEGKVRFGEWEILGRLDGGCGGGGVAVQEGPPTPIPSLVRRFAGSDAGARARALHDRLARWPSGLRPTRAALDVERPWLAFEGARGSTYRTLRRPDRPLARALELLRALAALHTERAPHGALCPEHVLREAGGLRLADLVPCPAAYLAPERLAGGPPSLRADVFAVGVIVHELVTGELPCGPPASARDRARLHPAYDPVLAACLAPAPSARPADAAEVAAALEQVTARLDARVRAVRAEAPTAKANELLARVMRGDFGFLPD